jgi:hypothetical protein
MFATTHSNWRIISKSIRGDSHKRSGLPNQDAIKLLPSSGIGRAVAVAVADGHGSSQSFRSAIGARLAVETSAALAESLLGEEAVGPPLSAIKRLAEDEVPQRLTRTWRKQVEEHVHGNPFTPDELSAHPGMSAGAGDTGAAIAYGSTIMTVVTTARYLLFWQLGDGDIVLVTPDGQASRPLPKDELLLGNETTSLCSPQAWRFVRVGFQALYQPVPPLVMVSTDGLANSFAHDAGFLQFGTDVLHMIGSDGPGVVEDNLAAWLTQITENASGDDITLAIITGHRDTPAAAPAPGQAPQDVPEEISSAGVRAGETEPGRPGHAGAAAQDPTELRSSR